MLLVLGSDSKRPSPEYIEFRSIRIWANCPVEKMHGSIAPHHPYTFIAPCITKHRMNLHLPSSTSHYQLILNLLHIRIRHYKSPTIFPLQRAELRCIYFTNGVGWGWKYERRGWREANISSLLYASHATARLGAAPPHCSINLKCAKVLNTGQPDRRLVQEIKTALINTFGFAEGQGPSCLKLRFILMIRPLEIKDSFNLTTIKYFMHPLWYYGKGSRGVSVGIDAS